MCVCVCVCVCVCLFVVGGSQKSARRDTCKEMFCVKLIVSPSSLRACQGGEAIPPLFYLSNMFVLTKLEN